MKFCETKELLAVLNKNGFRVTDTSFKALCRRNVALKALGKGHGRTKLWPLRSVLVWFEASSVRRCAEGIYDKDDDLRYVDGGEIS